MSKQLGQREVRSLIETLRARVAMREERQERLRNLNAPNVILTDHARMLQEARHALARVEQRFEENFAAAPAPRE